MREIPLTKGYVALVDDEDYERVSAFKWTAKVLPAAVYAYRNPHNETMYLHRLILDAPSGMTVDHINHDTLDNRRCNLRLATQAQNCWNRRYSVRARSGYRGVTRNGKGWRADIHCNGKKIYLGTHPTVEQAARAYSAKARELFGDFLPLNAAVGTAAD